MENPADDMELVLREADHRMKNMLTLFGTGFASTFRPSASVDLPHAIDRFERRIIAFGKLYQPLSNGSERRYISVGDYGGALCRALAGRILEPNVLRCEANIGDGFLDTKRCERLGLIIAELVTRDILLLPGNPRHVMHDGSGGAPLPARNRASLNFTISENLGSDERLDLLCGQFAIAPPHDRLLRSYLPPRLIVHAGGQAGQKETAAQLAGLVSLMRSESADDHLGSAQC